MTQTTPEPVIPVDAFNPLLDLRSPSRLYADMHPEVPGVAIITVRGPQTTTTVGLDEARIDQWLSVLAAIKQRFRAPSLIVPAAGTNLGGLRPGGHL